MSETSNNNVPATTSKEVAKKELSQSERFTRAVEKEFSGGVGEIQLTNFQRKLCQNYFIKIDMVLKEAEKKRLAKDEKYRDVVPLTWENVNINNLAVDVISWSGVGLDPTQPNQINPIPYKNRSTGKYDIAFIPGYKGLELKAKKYGLDIPDDVVVEVVYSNDNFKQYKKDMNHRHENYVFEVNDDFDRGEIKGGFYYHIYFDHPEKNRLRVFTLKEILKRKPEKASVEFWGGQKDKWEKDENGKSKKAGTETVDGWLDEMVYKTIYRAAYSVVTIDSEKIDDAYLRIMQKEREQKDIEVLKEIEDNANRTEIGFGNEQPQDAEIVNDHPTPPVEVAKQEVRTNGLSKAPF